MATKTVQCNFSDVDKTIKKHATFGWEASLVDFNKSRTRAKITFKRERNRNTGKLISLEKQYNEVHRLFYASPFIWAILGLGLIVSFFILKTFLYRVIFLMFGIPALGIGVYLFITRLILVLNSPRYSKLIREEAEIASGVLRLAPLVHNVAPEEENSNLIRANIKLINKK